jgi:hypothetical protein
MSEQLTAVEAVEAEFEAQMRELIYGRVVGVVARYLGLHRSALDPEWYDDVVAMALAESDARVLGYTHWAEGVTAGAYTKTPYAAFTSEQLRDLLEWVEPGGDPSRCVVRVTKAGLAAAEVYVAARKLEGMGEYYRGPPMSPRCPTARARTRGSTARAEDLHGQWLAATAATAPLTPLPPLAF